MLRPDFIANFLLEPLSLSHQQRGRTGSRLLLLLLLRSSPRRLLGLTHLV